MSRGRRGEPSDVCLLLSFLVSTPCLMPCETLSPPGSDAIVSTGAEVEFCHCHLEQSFRGLVQSTELLSIPGAHPGIAGDPVPTTKSLLLLLACGNYPFANLSAGLACAIGCNHERCRPTGRRRWQCGAGHETVSGSPAPGLVQAGRRAVWQTFRALQNQEFRTFIESLSI
jgi:hypothetical protein